MSGRQVVLGEMLSLPSPPWTDKAGERSYESDRYLHPEIKCSLAREQRNMLHQWGKRVIKETIQRRVQL